MHIEHIVEAPISIGICTPQREASIDTTGNPLGLTVVAEQDAEDDELEERG